MREELCYHFIIINIFLNYRDDIELMEEVHGPSKSRFEYKKQLPRGTQEDKRDYSHREPFVKYHDDPNDPQPHAI